MKLDTYAFNLLDNFVKEKLGGDIRKLRTYDLKTLADDRKYGDSIITRAPIVKAVMSLAFSDVWPELSVDTLNKGKFECDTINKYQNLFGINMCEQYFKGMQKFNPSSSQHQRALKVAHLTDSVGNLWVLPSSPSIASRILDNSYRYYMDKFLLAIYNVLTEKKRADKTLQTIIAKNKQMDIYKGEVGFDKFIQHMMLEDYMDYYMKPTEIFPFVWSAMKDLGKDAYFDAVDQFCTFCEKFIPKRADTIIEKLNMVLDAKPEFRMPNRPVIVTKLPKSQPIQDNNDIEANIIHRYGLAYTLMNMCIETVKDDIENRLSIMTDKDYFIELCKRMGLKLEGFTWDEFTISLEQFKNLSMIFYGFPKPQKEPEAKYGALLFDINSKQIMYYTLEMCNHVGRWALGRNTKDYHELMGIYEIEPTKENFIKLIIPKDKLLPEIDIKSLLNLPLEYKVLDKFPEDPMYSANYGKNTSNCVSFIQSFPMSARRAMDYYDVQKIINGIHQSLGDNQALIEVKAGKTNHYRQYVYSIVKTLDRPSRVQYFMLMHVAYEDIAINVNGHFVEAGMTGMRDSMIWELACRKGLVSISDNSKWMFDPYDKDLKRPYMMNLSEKEECDEMFPEHPLSQCRKFVKLITERL